MGPADANGNWLGSNSPQFAWDVENRMVFSGATDSASNWVTYSYDPWGKRVLQYASAGSASTVSTCVLYFYGANGKRLGTYNCGYSNGQFVVSTANVNVYFGKKLIASGSETNQNAVMTDRLGSVRGQNLSASIAYYPYGEERTSTPDNTDKFGTYFRDGYGQDYADQRYYTSSFGRFWSPDPGGVNTADPRNPVSWNRYAYVYGDPANANDPTGQFELWCEVYPFSSGCPSLGGGTGSGGSSGSQPGCLVDLRDSGSDRVVAEDDGHGPYSPPNGSGCNNGSPDPPSTGAYFNLMNAIQRQQAVNAITNLSQPCQNALATHGISTQQMAVNASSTNFYTTDVWGISTVQSISGYVDTSNPNMTLSQYVGNAGVAAALLNNNDTIINSVILNAVLYFNTISYGTSVAESQNITLVHEEMHMKTGTA
jgi:RHS repeat-associated protein